MIQGVQFATMGTQASYSNEDYLFVVPNKSDTHDNVIFVHVLI